MLITGQRTFGFDRRNQVPALAGTKPKLCITCQAWFAASGKQRRCDRDVPKAERQRREAERASIQASVPAVKRRQPRSELVLGVSLCRELAYELAATIDGDSKAGSKASIGNTHAPTMTRDEAYRFTRRNVALGLQDPRDLARYAP